MGVSDAPPDHEPSAIAVAPRERWPDYAAAQRWPEAGPPTTALGHRHDGALIQVHVEPSALSTYLQLTVDKPMPDGSRVLASLKSAAGAPLAAYLLEKRGGVWQALELDAEGGLVPGDGAACLRCHELAPTDYLFGPPRPETARPIGGEESLAPTAR